MPQLRRLSALPANFDAFKTELAQGIGALYGSAAGAEYEQIARDRFLAAIAHPAVDALAMVEGKDALALLWSVRREEMGEIGFLHVLREHEGCGYESMLLREAVRALRAKPVDFIVSEFLPACRLNTAETFTDLGFTRIDRVLMRAPLAGEALQPDACPMVRSVDRADWARAADTLVSAYRDHPGSPLHPEVRNREEALLFMERAALGGYGKWLPAYFRAIPGEEGYEAVILGCEVAPDTGFVLHVATRRACRGRGYGAALLRDLGAQFRRQGLRYMALGVTAANPARRLYERLGFTLLREVEAWSWWRS